MFTDIDCKTAQYIIKLPLEKEGKINPHFRKPKYMSKSGLLSRPDFVFIYSKIKKQIVNLELIRIQFSTISLVVILHILSHVLT